MLTERLYTVPEGAAELRLSVWTLWALLKEGKLARTKVAGKTFLRESELQRLIVDRINPRKPKRVRPPKTKQAAVKVTPRKRRAKKNAAVAASVEARVGA